jgi:hypothetical protein
MTIGSMRNIDVIVGANLMAGNVNPPTRGYPGGYPSSLEGIVAGPGVEIDVGVQLREEVAIYERLKGVVFCSRPSSFACEAAGYVIAEWLPFALGVPRLRYRVRDARPAGLQQRARGPFGTAQVSP